MELFLALLNIAGIVLVAFINYKGNLATHRLVNSRMSELLEMAKKNWREGREDEEKRHTNAGDQHGS